MPLAIERYASIASFDTQLVVSVCVAYMTHMTWLSSLYVLLAHSRLKDIRSGDIDYILLFDSVSMVHRDAFFAGILSKRRTTNGGQGEEQTQNEEIVMHTLI